MFGFTLSTLVTDVLSTFGVFLIIFSSIIFKIFHRRYLNNHLHTVVDGNKLFEKLKFDLKLSELTGVNRLRLYRSKDYASTIFRGAMDYNQRDFVWFFNEQWAKQLIYKNISHKANLSFLWWILIMTPIITVTNSDFLRWMWEQPKMTSTSAIISLWTLFLFGILFNAFTKLLTFFKVKAVINDEVRQINLTKKEKIWKDFKIIFFIEIGIVGLGFFFIILNLFFVGV